VSSPTDISELIQRLRSPEASVRRIAAMDLARTGEERALLAVCEQLEAEKDEKSALAMIRLVARFAPARRILMRLRDDPSTPVRVYHAALIAADGLER
jgi:HEAT repeat protein